MITFVWQFGPGNLCVSFVEIERVYDLVANCPRFDHTGLESDQRYTDSAFGKIALES